MRGYERLFLRLFLIILALLISTASMRAAMLIVAPTNSAAAVDLSAEGTLDWAHWGLEETNSFNRKLTVAPRISNFTLLGENSTQFVTNSPALLIAWTNGTPVVATNTMSHVAITGTESGFEFVVAADTTTKRLHLYFGLVAATATLEASLSDNSAGSFITNITSETATNLVYAFNYSAASPQQALRVRVTLTSPIDLDAALFLSAATLTRVGSNQPPLVTLISPTNETNVAADSLALEATAVDNDGIVSRVEFFDGTNKLGEVTNAPYSFFWTNAAIGAHTLSARAWDDEGTNRSSAAATIFVITTGGSISPVFNAPTGTVNLTLEGSGDWIHWGLLSESSTNRKAGVTPRIGTFTIVGSGPHYQFFDNANGYTWTDGTPRAGVTNTRTGVYIFGVGNGFEIQAPATNAFRTLRVHVGAYAGRGRLRAFLSDFSAPVVNDISVNNTGNGPGGIYTLTYSAAAPGQKLIVRYTLASRYASDGNVTLQAASLLLDNNPPSVAINSPTNRAVVLAGTNVTFFASATDSDGTVSHVEFYNNDALVSVSSNAPFEFTMTNIVASNYTVVARAFDAGGAFANSMPILLHAITGAGFLRGSMTNAPAAVNLSNEGTLDWAHWAFQSKNTVNRRAGVSSMIGDLSSFGDNHEQRYTDNFTAFSWINGTPDASVSATKTGLYLSGLSNGFQLTVRADQQANRLKIYAGLYGSRSRFEASLSDFSAPPYVNNSLVRSFANGYAVYTVDFAAGSSNQTLTVRYFTEEVNDVSFGNVTWQAATLTPLFSGIIITPHLPPQNGAVFSGEFRTLPGVNYSVESSDNLNPPTWLPFTNLMGGTSNAVFYDSRPATERFYRLKVN
jgi:hypothetical protein